MTIQSQHCVRLLSKLPLFQDMQESDLDSLSYAVQLMHVARKETLFKQGDICRGFYALVYGRVKLSLKSIKNIEKPLQIVEAGGNFGDITMLLGCPYYLTAQTLEDCLLIFIPWDATIRMIERDNGFARKMLLSMSVRMRNVVDDIESFSLQPPLVRLILYLLRSIPSETIKSIKIDLTVPKNVIAAQLNLTPETLSRCFRDLINNKLIVLEGKSIVVNDISQLRDYIAPLSEENLL